MFGMLSVLAELQRELIVANTMDGLASARARGRVGGRRPRLSEDQAALAQELYDARVKTVQQIADLFGVPRSTVYGHLNKETTVSRQPQRRSRWRRRSPRYASCSPPTAVEASKRPSREQAQVRCSRPGAPSGQARALDAEQAGLDDYGE